MKKSVMIKIDFINYYIRCILYYTYIFWMINLSILRIHCNLYYLQFILLLK